MQLTLEQQNELMKHLNSKWKNRECDMCGEKNWTISDVIFEMREFHGGNMVIGGGSLLPISPITCTNCGNTHFLNSLAVGIVKNDGVSKKGDGSE